MAQNDLSNFLSGTQDFLAKLEGVELPADLEEKRREFLEALSQAVNEKDTTTSQTPPPRPAKNEPPKPEEEEEPDDTYDDTLPPPPPQLNSNADGDDNNDANVNQAIPAAMQEDNYEITQGGAPEEAGEQEYELLPSEQQEDFYDAIEAPPPVSAPRVPASPVAESEIDYTSPVKVADIKGILKEGWLGKHKKEGQFSLFSQFQRRYCVLVKHALYYYQSNKDKSQKGQIILNGYQVIYPPKQVPGAKHLDHCFELNGPGKRKFQVIKFMASSKEDAQEWTRLLNEQLSQKMSRHQSERLSEMERKSVETDRDSNDDGSEKGSLSGMEVVDGQVNGMGNTSGAIDEDMYEPLPEEQAGQQQDDIYEFIPGNQQIPTIPSLPPMPRTPIPPRSPNPPLEQLAPSLPARHPVLDAEQGEAVQEDIYNDVEPQQDTEDFYDDVADRSAIVQQILEQEQQQEAQPSDQAPSSEEPAPVPPRPPKSGAVKQSKPEPPPKPVEEERRTKPKPDEDINPADVYVALWNCSADGEDELEFTRGEFIHVLKKLSEHWWIGVRMESKELDIGLVPCAFLQEAY